MINVLTPDQISKYWDILSFAIEQSLPPIASRHRDRMNRILMTLLSGKAMCWVAYRIDDEVRSLDAVCVTQILFDGVSLSKNLLIYSLYGFTSNLDSLWTEGIKVFAKYARSKGCENIVAYTQNERIVEMASVVSGNESHNFVKFNVSKIIGE